MLYVLNLLGWTLATLAYVLGARRQVTLKNLRKAFPEKRGLFLLGLKSHQNLGRVFAEMIYLRFGSRASISRGLTISNPDLVKRCLDRGHGVILLSAHLANWEWMAVGTGLRLGEPINVIVKNQRSGFSEQFLNTMRSRFGNSLVEAGDVRGAFRVLQHGKILALLGDQAAPGGSVKVRFFGRMVPTFEGPARFALRTRAPLLLAECVRKRPGRYEMTFHDVPFDDIPGHAQSDVDMLTARHTAMLESIIRKQPELWLWQHKRWKNAD